MLHLLPSLQTLRLEICDGIGSFEGEVDRKAFNLTSYFDYEVSSSISEPESTTKRTVAVNACLLLRSWLYNVDEKKSHLHCSIHSNVIFYRARPSADLNTWRGLKLQAECARRQDFAQIQGVHGDWARQGESIFQGELPYTERMRGARKTDGAFYHLRHPMLRDRGGWEHETGWPSMSNDWFRYRRSHLYHQSIATRRRVNESCAVDGHGGIL